MAETLKTRPRDEGAHYTNTPYQFNQLIEWWYFNGRLTTDDGRNLSYDVALFNPAAVVHNRVFTQPFLHIQVSDLDNHVAYVDRGIKARINGAGFPRYCNPSLGNYILKRRVF